MTEPPSPPPPQETPPPALAPSAPALAPRRKEPPAERIWRQICEYFVGEDPTFWVAMVPMLALAAILYTRHPQTNCIFDEQEALLANPYVQGKMGWLAAFQRDFWGLPPDRSVGSYRPIPDILWRAEPIQRDALDQLRLARLGEAVAELCFDPASELMTILGQRSLLTL